MRPRISFLVAGAALLFAALGQQSVVAADAKAGWYSKIVDTDTVMQYAVIPKRDDVVIVDSRPAGKYDEGHVPAAIGIPDRKFDKMTDMLPADKSTPLVFYCGGLKCPLSHKSAFKAEKAGYTNIQVYAAGYPDWIAKGNLGSVSAAYVKKLLDKKADVVIIDARPERKFKEGHVPTAINIPDRKFAKMTGLLPEDKKTPLVFYCGGLKCPLSPKSAAKAVKLGYTKVKLFQAGYPAWKAAYDAPKPAAAVPQAGVVAIDTGKETDTITVASFEKILKAAPESVLMLDVRDPSEYEGGHFKPAVNMTVDEVEEKVAELPTGKPIVFVCSTGTRSAEAFDIVKMERNDVEAYFLDANVDFAKDGSYTITPNVH
ncbi:MAG: rhodanese-like domain-containing protein [Rhodospirillales bacterium]|nr:rhodanese-like domain-containing protein [Rhodospirillales bacterium]